MVAGCEFLIPVAFLATKHRLKGTWAQNTGSAAVTQGPQLRGKGKLAPLTLGQEVDSPGLVWSLLSLMPFNPEGLLCPQSRKSSKLRADVSRSGQREEQKGPASLSQDTF